MNSTPNVKRYKLIAPRLNKVIHLDREDEYNRFRGRPLRISISNKQTSALTLVYRSSRLIREHRRAALKDCATQQRKSTKQLTPFDRPPRSSISPRNQLIIPPICMKIDRKATFLSFFYLCAHLRSLLVQYNFLPRQFYYFFDDWFHAYEIFSCFAIDEFLEERKNRIILWLKVEKIIILKTEE